MQLHLPDGGRGGPPLEQGPGQAPVQVRARPHSADAQGRGRQELQLRLPEGGRQGDGWRFAGAGADGGGRGRAEDEHHDARTAGAAAVGAGDVPDSAGEEEGARGPGEAVHTGLQAGIRALLHPRGRAGRARRDREEPPAERVAHGAVQDDSA